MTCSFARLLVWTLREWFASDRSLRALARLELAWTERDLASAWPRLALFLSIVDFERQRELEISTPLDGPPDRVTADEAAVLAALACARWSAADAAVCLAGFLDGDSAAAAARAAARVRDPRAERPLPLAALLGAFTAPGASGSTAAMGRLVRASHA